LHIAPEGLQVGSEIEYDGKITVGNVVELGKIPEGTKICGIETYPGSGSKLCRSSGSFAEVVGRVGEGCSSAFFEENKRIRC